MAEYRLMPPKHGGGGKIEKMVPGDGALQSGDGRTMEELLAENEKLKKENERLKDMPRRDSLTSLFNRDYFLQELEDRLSATASLGGKIALFYIDLDGFKKVNDTHPDKHAAGDVLLQRAAHVVSIVFQAWEDAVIARLGGDEFGVFFKYSDIQEACWVADRLLDEFRLCLRMSFEFLDDPVTASIGIACFPGHGKNAAELVGAGDHATYNAKALGKDRYCLYDPESPAEKKREVVRGAVLFQEGLTLRYHPTIDLRNPSAISKVEALVRIVQADGTEILPDDFLHIVVGEKLLENLSYAILRGIFADLRTLIEAGCTLQKVRVNLDPDIFQFSFPQKLKRIATNEGLDPSYLDIELTEKAPIKNLEVFMQVAWELRAMGIHLIMDDYGIGHSTLSWMMRVHNNGSRLFEAIKLDRSYVEGLHEDTDKATAVRWSIGMAHDFGLAVTAEGPKAEDFEVLLENGCFEIQTFACNQPFLVGELIQYIQKGAPLPESAQRAVASLRFRLEECALFISSPLRIIMVDDHEGILHSSSIRMQAWGHQVRTIQRGEDVEEALRIFNPDAVIIDINLGGPFDGYAIAGLVQERSPLAVRIALSALERDKTKPLQLFHEYVTKPGHNQIRSILLRIFQEKKKAQGIKHL